jgi:hypothetical protein
LKKYICEICDGAGIYSEDGFDEKCHHCKETGFVNYKQVIYKKGLHFEMERMVDYRSKEKWFCEVTELGNMPRHLYTCDSWGKSYKQAIKRSLKKCREEGYL